MNRRIQGPLRALFPYLAVLTLAVATFPLVAQERTPPKVRVPEAPDAVIHRPLAVPDRIILTWKGDPAHSQAVTWRTDSSVRRAVAQIAPADHGPAFVRQARTLPAVTAPLRTNLGTAHYHSVDFQDLQPSTMYAYRVGDGVNWSEWIHFRTASDAPEPFSFIYFGDAQNDLKSLWSRVVREAYSDAPRARFILHAGDLINHANRDAEWGEWFGAGGWVNAMVPSIPTPGNHEYAPGPRLRGELSRHWRPQFTLPENGPPGLEETAYYVDYQGVRIVSLNSNERRREQAEWLEEVLRDNPNRWTILTFHHPLYSSARGRDNTELRELWLPVIDRYRVDLVLQGHDHTYARSNLRTGVNKREAESGTVFVVSVSGPKMYNLDREPWMERAAEDTQLYQVISLDGDRLRYEARTATGDLYDAFDLRKDEDGGNRLIERPSKRIPERLRSPRVAPAAR
ncbi:MAG TPA: metallophosphoesterase family protein [Armatimonadota bacterium]|nr:metallophosphoesterase family protein [Armatimonadota bacterium]